VIRIKVPGKVPVKVLSALVGSSRLTPVTTGGALLVLSSLEQAVQKTVNRINKYNGNLFI
jgi:hypothetical protein